MNAMPRRRVSLRAQLLVGLLALLLVALSIGGVASYRIASAEAGALLDRQLEQTALALRDRATGESAAAVEVPTDLEVVIQIWDAFGSRVFASDPTLPAPSRTGPGFSTVRTPSGAWRVFVIPAGNALLQVAQPLDQRNRVAANIAVRVALPFALVLPALALAGWWWIGTRLRPLDRLARSVQSREARALAPIVADDVPTEARPLIDALNALLARLDDALRVQREFIADAAHTLRTPLAAVKMQAQIAQRTDDAQARAAALSTLDAGVQRASRLVQQLLDFARVDAQSQAAPVRTAFDAVELARDTVTAFESLAHARGIDCGLAHSEPAAPIHADRDAIRTLLENLIDNALRYTPRGGRVDVGVAPGHDGVTLAVDDSGPGIAPEQRARLIERFARGEHPHAIDGAGLGLAIVDQIARRHGAALTLGDSALGGLRAAVTLPLVASSGSPAAAP